MSVFFYFEQQSGFSRDSSKKSLKELKKEIKKRSIKRGMKIKRYFTKSRLTVIGIFEHAIKFIPIFI